MSVVSLQYVFYCSLQRCLRCGDEWKGLGGWRKETWGLEHVCVHAGLCTYVSLKCLYLHSSTVQLKKQLSAPWLKKELDPHQNQNSYPLKIGIDS